ncbi:MAG TPA: AraC family transcriptional regulator [Chitinophaga sp.]|uniref:AraC family transcriptional regulator n=1 Tax=Chitinophaga sp. TaxID=1869181 RepID=UPI002CA47D0E|nr:AraC family transcriptional regulator [Chitinophaga sp.]HVI44965.1 AraC family transcriptional regulator [Chitinophaga sp.]
MSKSPKRLFIERDDYMYTPYQAIPTAYHNHLIPYAKYYYQEDHDGSILDQNIKTGDFSIWFHSIRMHHGIQLQPFAQYHVIALHASDDIPVMIADEAMGQQKEVSIFNVMPEMHSHITTEDNAESFHINIEPAALPALAREFPALRPLAALPIMEVTRIINKAPFRLNPVSRLITERIRKSKYIGKPAAHFFRRNAADFFSNYARLLAAPDPIMMNQVQLQLLHEIFQYIVHNLHLQHTHEELHQVFNVDKAMLERPFEQEFHITIPELVLQEKMALAFDLLAGTDIPMSGILERIGYSDLPAFTRTFDKYFRCDPILLRNAQ